MGAASIQGSGSLTAVSCPSVSLCVAVDGQGNTPTSTEPTGGAAAWSARQIGGLPAAPLFFGQESGSPPGFAGGSCPSASLCVAAGTEFFGGLAFEGSPPSRPIPRAARRPGPASPSVPGWTRRPACPAQPYPSALSAGLEVTSSPRPIQPVAKPPGQRSHLGQARAASRASHAHRQRSASRLTTMVRLSARNARRVAQAPGRASPSTFRPAPPARCATPSRSSPTTTAARE